MEFCKFCQYGNNHHADNCCRDEPGANERFDQGYREGRGNRKCSSEDPAHVAGWLRGDCALDAYYNDYPGY